MIRGTNKSKRTTMMRVTNGIVAAFVAVLLCNSHYHRDGVGMVAAAAVSGGGEEETDTTTRGTMMTTVVDGVPVEPTRKLIKRSKASKPDADVDGESLLRFLVFTTAMDMYLSMQLPPSLETAVARAGNDDGGRRELVTAEERYEERYDEYVCDNCLAFYTKAPDFLQAVFCSSVSSRSLPSLQLKHQNHAYYTCRDILQCATKPNRTPTTCCATQGLCKTSGYYCKLSCNSGSCENYWIQTETQAECNTESTAIGCGDCKNQVDSTAILEKAGMPTNGFVSLCAGGPCVWIEQKTQCMGLKHYPAITTSSACEDACCGDNNCAVWQFDADGYSDQCWYGTVEFDWYPDPTYTQCRDKGSLTWSYGGIRKIPDCDPNYFNY